MPKHMSTAHVETREVFADLWRLLKPLLKVFAESWPFAWVVGRRP